MKKFNLKDKKLISDIELHDQEINALFPLTERIQNATVALFKCHKMKKPELIGSGVLFNILSHYFLFTAAHVYTSNIGIALKTEPIFEIQKSDWFSSLDGQSGTHEDDNIDAAVCYFLTDIPEELKKNALMLDDVDTGRHDENSTYFISGYLISKLSRPTYDRCIANGIHFNTSESHGSYDVYDINRKTHLATVYKKYAIKNSEQRTMFKPNGLSGGSMSRIIVDDATKEKKCVLSAIVVEHKPEERLKAGCIVGSRIQYHLSYIWEYMPELRLAIDNSNIF
ncbi:hypothetical protein [Seleniivibrio sp.]|uniref:hypothetical protein n=1 Tax=Seleniivibrio sp. TaxID=2898801 RepID=UPI0025E9D29D|nr:hypothetical protein [Seleniivibrio sp.]MCD8553583.1 hypothetical protein [Seleniivibrio sp.]